MQKPAKNYYGEDNSQASIFGNNFVSEAILEVPNLSGPNRAMQWRCAIPFELHTPKSLAMRKSFLLAMQRPIRLI